MTSTIGFSKPKPKFQPSTYQQAIFDWVVSSQAGKNLIVEAVAGSGKSTTGIEIFNLLDRSIDSAFVAFNAHIARELKAKLPEGANARTYHSLGLATLKRTFPNMEVNEDKVEDYLKTKLDTSNRWLIGGTRKLVSLCKGHAHYDPDDDFLEKLSFMYDVDLYEEKNEDIKWKIFGLAKQALENSKENTAECDFDDMIGLPNVLENISFFQYDFLFGDEVQDTNAAQTKLLVNSISDNGNIVGVGDRRQSIYAFRGAGETAMDDLKEALHAEELPLSISYRCPVAVRKLVNEKFPEIKFEVPEWAEEGKVGSVMSNDLEHKLKPDDMVLCRINADLVPLAFAILKSGQKATIRGRDIGKGLVTLIKKSRATYADDLYDWLGRWKDAEIQKAHRLDAEEKIQTIKDKFDTLYALGDGATTVAEIAERCDKLFSDDKVGVVLSTIHRAKGLEADNVYILRPDLIPHPAAKSEAQLLQERNLLYVAITRCRKELNWVY